MTPVYRPFVRQRMDGRWEWKVLRDGVPFPSPGDEGTAATRDKAAAVAGIVVRDRMAVAPVGDWEDA